MEHRPSGVYGGPQANTNPFHLKREEGPQHGPVPKIYVMSSSLPQNFTEIQARSLAAELIKFSGGREAFMPFLDAVCPVVHAPAPHHK